MLSRPQEEKALLVHVFFSQDQDLENVTEFQVLARSAHLHCIETITCTRKGIHAKYFLGTGKADEIAEKVRELEISVVLFNHTLSPSQKRNLATLFGCKVVDRTGLILDIFAQRARTYEGKLQVELAQLQYLSTTLVQGWSNIERQKGGIGLRGPGETKLESDRRLIKQRIQFIQNKLAKVVKQRNLNRQARKKVELPTVSLVGYTNAGKSTLFNRLTHSTVYVADQLFATLDPTLRRIEIDEVGEVVFADTVGFIRHLPHDLVAAFKATLQEVQEATLLLHVVDASDPNYLENIKAVEVVLAEMDAQDIPSIFIMNKIDRLENPESRFERNSEGEISHIWLSVQEDQGLEWLFSALQERLSQHLIKCKLHIPVYLSRLRSLLYHSKAIQNEQINATDGSFEVEIKLPQTQWQQLCKQHPDLHYLVTT